MNSDIAPSASMTVRAGERLLSSLRAYEKALKGGTPKGIESARARAVVAGAQAHRAVRDVCCELLEDIEGAACDFVKAVFCFDESALSGPDCGSVLTWADSLPALQFVAPLRLAYRRKTSQYAFDEASAIAVARLYNELKRVGSRALLLTKIYKEISAKVIEASESAGEIIAVEPLG